MAQVLGEQALGTKGSPGSLMAGTQRGPAMAKIRKMRIHSFGDSAVLQADTVEPSLPDASEVLASVKAASVNPVDFKIRSGKYPAVREERLPYCLGRDVRVPDRPVRAQKQTDRADGVSVGRTPGKKA
jgi:hypothetical protein